VSRLLLAAVIVLVQAQAEPAWRAAQVQSFDTAWQTINETFYDPEFGGIDWVAVRDELRPRAEQAASPEEARGVIREMLGRLGRSHFALLSDEADERPAGPAVTPIEVRVTGNTLIVTRVDAVSGVDGVEPGDVVLAIDGMEAAGFLQGLAGLTSHARALQVWRRVDLALRGRQGSEAVLRLRGHDGSERTVRVPRWLPPGEPVRFGNLPELRVRLEHREVRTAAGRRAGLLAFNFWMPALLPAIDQAVETYRERDALIIDLRGNLGGIVEMIRGVAGHLLDEPVLLGQLRMRMVPEPLKLTANPRRSTADGRSVAPFSGPVAILVDELTGSTSECFAGALQGLGRARVFGRPTMGQALPALTKRLPSGDVLMYVVGDFVTGAGQSLEGRGVVPDEAVPLAPNALAAGRDPILEAALAWVDTQKGAWD